MGCKITGYFLNIKGFWIHFKIENHTDLLFINNSW